MFVLTIFFPLRPFGFAVDRVQYLLTSSMQPIIYYIFIVLTWTNGSMQLKAPFISVLCIYLCNGGKQLRMLRYLPSALSAIAIIVHSGWSLSIYIYVLSLEASPSRVSISLYPYQDGRDGKLRALTVGGWRESLSLIEWTTRQETHMWSASEMFFFFNALVWTLHQRKLFVWSGCKVLHTSVLEYIPYIRFHPHANAIHFEHKHMLSSSLADDIRQVILLSPQLCIHTFVYAFCEMQLNNLQRTECAARSPSPFILTNNVRPETGWQNLQFTS